MSHSSQERDRSKNNSYKTRSNATCSTTDTQRSIMKAAVRKAELKCRQKALKKTAELEKRALEVKQEMKMLEINTELEVEDAKLAAYESFSNSSQSSLNESDPMTHSEKKVKDWLYDDNKTPVLKNTVLLDEPFLDIGLRPPMQPSENKDQHASPMPFAWKLDTYSKHELSSPSHHLAQCEVSQSFQHPERTSHHDSPLRWKPNMDSYERSPPLQYMKQPETSPIQRSERRDQCTFPMQGTPNMFETTSTPVVRSSNPFANHMSSVPLANNAISQPMLHTYRDYGGMQHGANYVPPGPAVGPTLNPFVNSMSSEPFENNTTESRMNGDYRVIHQQKAHLRNSSRDDTATILEKLRHNQREAAPPPQKQTPAGSEVINQQSPSSTAFPIDAPTPLRPAAPRMTRIRFPIFNGDLKDYNRFKQLFNHCTVGMAELDTFYQLIESMERKQDRDKIKGCINLKHAWQVLDEVYGDQGKLVDSLLTEVENLRMYEKGGKPHLPEMSICVQTLQNMRAWRRPWV